MFARKLKTLFFLFFICLNAIDGIADESDLNFMNISTKEGLSSNTANAMLKDRLGFMWFATADGLNKFDGKHFTIYQFLIIQVYLPIRFISNC